LIFIKITEKEFDDQFLPTDNESDVEETKVK
jgi:hypothetical protein